MASRRSTGLDFAGAYNRRPGPGQSQLLSALADDGLRSKSATVTRLERELKEVKEENQKLRSEAKDLRSLLDEMVSPGCPENFDERRVNLLKAQILQMQRQCNLLNDAIGSRYTVLMEIENSLAWMADNLRSHIAAEVSGATVPVPRAELMKMVQSIESARIRLFKNLEDNNRDKLQRALLFTSEFVAPACDGLTLLDVCSGKTNHINLRQVGKLESKLSMLYRDLVGLSEALDVRQPECCHLLSSHTAEAVSERLRTQLLKSAASLKDCSEDLLSLSMLIPSSPSSKIRRLVVKGISVQQVMSKMPSLPRYKTDEVQAVVKAVVKCMNHRQQLLEKEVQILRKEVKFHQAVYQLQLDYVRDLFQAVRNGYVNFQDNTNDVVVKPLQVLLKTYQDVKRKGDESSLRKFFALFKEHEDQLSEAVRKLGLDCAFSNGLDSLSVFGAEFESSLEDLVAGQQSKRDKMAGAKEELREEQERLDSELRALIGDAQTEEKRLQDLRQQTDAGSQEDLSHRKPTAQDNSHASHGDVYQTKRKAEKGVEKNSDKVSSGSRFDEADSSTHEDLKSSNVESLRLREWQNSSLHEREWRGPLDLSDDEVTSPQVTSRSGFSVQVDTFRSGETSRQVTADAEDSQGNLPASSKETRSVRSHARPPRPTSYQPNLVVPNRTLKLRRSENLSRRGVSECPSPGLASPIDAELMVRELRALAVGAGDWQDAMADSGFLPGDRGFFSSTSGRLSRSSSRPGSRSGFGVDRPPSADRR